LESTQQQIIEFIRKSRRILVLPSSPPDGDSLGSAIALYMALKKLGKEVTVVCNDPIPEVLQFLPNSKVIGNKILASHDFIITIDLKNSKIEHIKSNIENDKVNIIIHPKEGRISEDDLSFNKGEVNYDLIITVDTAELKQIRGFYEDNIEMFHQIPVINIDHHISNANFGKLNLVDVMASSTTEIILPILEELSRIENKDLIDEDTATLLLTGIITDTGSFQNANTTPKSFDEAAKLVSYGARQQEIIQHIYKTKQLSQLKLWGRVLSKIQTDEEHKMVWSIVSQQDFKDTQSTEDQTGDIIDELLTNAPGAEVILLMKEKSDGSISVSVRTTTPSTSAAKIAQNFDGGGHTQAAGFRISGKSLQDAEFEVVNFVKEFQKKKLGYDYEKEISAIESLSERAPEVKVEPKPTPKPAKKSQPKPEPRPKLKLSTPNLDHKKDESEDEGEVLYKFED